MLRENSLENTIRPPMGPTLARKVLDHMKNWQAKVSDQWKARANAHQAMMDKGDPHGFAKVYKSLRVLQQEDSLSTTDRKHLKQSAAFLSEELANALGQTQSETLDQMTKVTQV